MYRREEHIEEEIIDWGDKVHLLEENLDTSHPTSQKIRYKMLPKIFPFLILPHLLALQHHLKSFISQNIKFISIISVILFPYFMGFICIYALVYYYTNISIFTFLELNKINIGMQFWSLGAYIFITLWLFFAFLKIISQNR